LRQGDWGKSKKVRNVPSCAVHTSYRKIVQNLKNYPCLPAKKKWGLENVQAALSEINNPHKNYEKVQVIGTNGKGSTSFFLSKILSAHRIRTGLYVSPHLTTIREMIRVDNGLISGKDFKDIYSKLADVFVQFHLTHFEKLTLMAAEYFARKNVNVCVFETGLGGRLDAVTALDCGRVIYTSISRDHTEFLGDTIEQIAYEKAHAMAKCKKAFSSPQPEKVKTVLMDFAGRHAVDIVFVHAPCNVEIDRTGTKFEFENQKYVLPMFGCHYAVNAALALRSARHILGKNFRHKTAENALKRSFWKGGLHIVNKKGCVPVLFSCAHNESSIAADLEAVKTIINKNIISGNIEVLFGTSRKRPSDEFVHMIQAEFKNITVTKVPPYEYPFTILKGRKDLVLIEDYKEALDKLIRMKHGAARTVLVIGSIYLCGLVTDYMKKISIMSYVGGT
jgi:dihydrofolate synthase/folylpolyglutamate synthase